MTPSCRASGWFFVAGVALALAGGARLPVRAQGTQGAERAQELITADFLAVTSDGEPVADLTAAEVSVRINGRARPIRSLQLTSIASSVARIATGAATSLPPPFGSNDVAIEGRTFYLVIDDDSFRVGRERVLRDAVDKFLTALSPFDRVALVTMPYGGVRVGLTLDHSRIRTSFSTIIGQASADETGSQLACRTLRTLESLIGLIETLPADAAPKTIIFVSGGLAGPRRDNVPMLAPGPCELRSELFQQVGVAAGAARAQFYIVQPDETTVRTHAIQRENIAGVGYTGSDNPLEGIENLAGVTGAHRLNLSGSPETAFGRIVRETSAHYVAAFVPDRNDRTGRSLQLSVRVNRPNVIVRARPEITFRAPDPRDSATTVRQMVLSGRSFRDLPLRVAAYASREAADDQPVQGTVIEPVRIITLIEPVDAAAKLATVGAVLIDEQGKTVTQWAGSGSDLTTLPIRAGMIAPAGAYRLRVAAIDAQGRGGTVDTEVAADLTPAGPLRLSSLILGLSREGGFVPKLQFSAEPVALGQLEIYGGTPGLKIVAALELATSLNGPAVVTVPLAVRPVGPNRYIATGAIPIGSLPAGDFAVRAIVGADGQPAGRVIRTLRKVT
jgi:hypothetical protein